MKTIRKDDGKLVVPVEEKILFLAKMDADYEIETYHSYCGETSMYSVSATILIHSKKPDQARRYCGLACWKYSDIGVYSKAALQSAETIAIGRAISKVPMVVLELEKLGAELLSAEELSGDDVMSFALESPVKSELTKLTQKALERSEKRGLQRRGV